MMKLRRGTFKNRLKVKDALNGVSKRVYFHHPYRCPVDAWFEETNKNPFGWVMQFETPNDHILKSFRNEIFKAAVAYIEKRSKKKAMDIKFYQIEQLAAASEVKSAQFHVM